MIKALRPLIIDRQYTVGEIIPDGILKPERLNTLKGCKLIAEVDELPKTEAPINVQEDVQVKKIYSKDKLSKLNKKKLTEIAENEGIDVSGLTNKEIVNTLTGPDNA